VDAFGRPPLPSLSGYNPVHETCTGLVCPGDFTIAGVFFISQLVRKPLDKPVLGLLHTRFPVRGEKLHCSALPQ